MRSVVRAVRRLLALAVAGRPASRVCALLVLGVALGSVAVPAAGEGVLRAGGVSVSAEKQLELAADPYVMRWRVAGMDSDAVFGAVAGAEPLVVNLFGDVEVKARVRSAKTLDGGSRFLAGALEDGGHFTLFRHATGIVRGEFHSATGSYALRSRGPGNVLVTQQDVSKLPGCGNDGLAGGPAGFAPALAERPRTAPPMWAAAGRGTEHWRRQSGLPSSGADAADSEGKPIDVLVIYTQRVEDHEGGLSQVQATIENEMAKTNQVLENSGLSHRRMRLAAMEKVDYEQRESLGTDMDN